MTIGIGHGSHRRSALLRGVISVVVLALVATGCGGDEVVEAGAEVVDGESTAVDPAQELITAATVGIVDKEPEIGPAALGQLDYAEANPEVCPDEFASFNQPYPEDRAEAAELDEGIEDRGRAIVGCLLDAGQDDLAEDLALLTAWSRHLADEGR